MAMELVVVKYCFTCKRIRPATDHHCTECGARLKIPNEDSLRLEIAAKLLDEIKTNGNNSDEIVRKLKRLSLAPTSEEIQMKFCLRCKVEKPLHHKYCATENCGAKLIIPNTIKERLDAMQILLNNINIQPSDTHYEILRSVWTAVTRNR